MKLSTMLLGAAAIGLLSTSFAMADDYLGGAVKSSMVGGKEILTDSKGMTLYYFDRDVSGNKSTCDGKCTEKWIPVAAPGNAEAQGDFTVITRNDGSKMWAYRYRPLYTSPADHAPGDANGYDPEQLWHVARP